METSDAVLVQQSLAGDARAFEQLIRRYQGLVFSIIGHYLGGRADVEDLAQDVFLKLYKALAAFDTGRSMKAWLARIATNRCYDELRKIRNRPQSLFCELAREEQEDLERFYRRFQAGDGFQPHEVESMFELLQRLLEQLPDKDRMAFVWREIEGQEYGEIAETMETTELAVRIRVSRSRKRLTEMLREHCTGVGEHERRAHSL